MKSEIKTHAHQTGQCGCEHKRSVVVMLFGLFFFRSTSKLIRFWSESFRPWEIGLFYVFSVGKSALSSGRAKPVSEIYWVVNYFLMKFMKAKFRSKIENKFNLLKDAGCLKGNESNISCCSTCNVTESWDTPWFVEFPSIQNCLLQNENTSL